MCAVNLLAESFVYGESFSAVEEDALHIGSEQLNFDTVRDWRVEDSMEFGGCCPGFGTSESEGIA